MEEEEKVHAGIKFHFTNTGCRLFRQFDRSILVVDEALPSPLSFFLREIIIFPLSSFLPV